MSSVHISLSAEKLTTIAGIFPVTNSLLSTWIVMGAIILMAIRATRKLALVPGNLQSVLEILVGGFYGLFETVLHDQIGRFFPLLGTLFLFIITMNWFGLLPGVGTVGIYELEEGHKTFIPLFRSGSADLNTTLALALIVVVFIQYSGVKSLGISYFKRFINISNPIYFFVGILDIISEFAKILSFSFRLFGNIFAGEVLLTVIAFLMPFVAPLPFLGLELFVGFIQALVFSMLTAVFLSVATAKSEH
ncbi:F0F1 ATP synthase subunit A [Candidatus Gottesmanbacteria bacterium]|nr:F0F1 ATP synthase subunit A [Candidatus Gottesmanbacteria bacterium]